MRSNISTHLEGSDSYSIFYELSNGNVVHVFAIPPETQAEMEEMIKYDPEHAKEIESGDIYIVREYDPDLMLEKYAQDPGWYDDGELMDYAEAKDYGTYYGNDAKKNGLIDAIEADGVEIVERYTPYTSNVVDFIDPKERYEQSRKVNQVEITGINPYDMSEIVGDITLENGDTYPFVYNPETDTFAYADAECDDIVVKPKGELIARDDMEDNMIRAFESCYNNGEDLQLYPEFYNEHISIEMNGDEEWIYGSFTTLEEGYGTDPRIDFYCPVNDPDSLEIDRQGSVAPRSVPNHLLEATFEKADNMVMEFFSREQEKETPKKSRNRGM